MDGDAGAWIDREVAECRLPDERLTKRLRKLLDQMAGAMGGRIPPLPVRIGPTPQPPTGSSPTTALAIGKNLVFQRAETGLSGNITCDNGRKIEITIPEGTGIRVEAPQK